MLVKAKAEIREHAVRALRYDRVISHHSRLELEGTAARLARDLGLDARAILAEALRSGNVGGYPYLIADHLGQFQARQ